MHAIKDDEINHDVMIGLTLLQDVEVTICNSEVSLKKVNRPVQSDTNQFEFGTCLSVEEFIPREEIKISHLEPNLRKEIIKLVAKYDPKEKVESPITMKIILSDDVPVYKSPRRIPFADQVYVDKQIAEWLTNKIIRPSNSEYASPIVLVPKKDISKRLCCDYRKLNKKIIRDNFPMPLVDEVIDRLQNAGIFTTLDLVNGFFHVPVDENSRK